MLWVLTTKGRRMPLDAEPVEDGNVWLETTPDGLIGHVEFGGNSIPLGTDTYLSHFATCPDAKAHRRKA